MADFVPRVPFTPAERHVDWAGHNNHIVSQRDQIEKAALPAARRLAVLAATLHGPPSLSAIEQLATKLQTSLEATARHGAASVVAEVTALRTGRPAEPAVTAAWQLNDTGRYATVAAEGIDGVLRFVIRRAIEVARAIADATAAAVHDAQSAGEDALFAALQASARSLHLHVLELVGETLNLGRTAGALSLSTIPEFALRSEQLDASTCSVCDALHGTIVVVGSPEYFAMMPPSGCLGGGRCRGLYVFGDGPRDVRQPESLAA